MNKTIRANLCILLAAIIWGSAFVTQRMGMDSIGPIYFNVFRMLLGGVVLIIVANITDRLGVIINDNDVNDETQTTNDNMTENHRFWNSSRKTLLIGGLTLGVIITFASNFQQIGLVSIDAGKSGFLTAMYVVLVPIFGLLLHKPVHYNHIIAAILGVIGLYFLCINGSFNLQVGDLLSLVGAIFWALHIMAIDHFAPKLNPIKLSAMQFIVCGILSFLLAQIIHEDFTWQMLSEAKFAIAYTGIMSSAIAFTLQIAAQRNANPTAASLIMSTEALFATICGFLFLGEMLTLRELLGALFMLVAVIIAQASLRELADLFKHK